MTGSARLYSTTPGLAVLVRRQHGVVTRSQLAALGLTWAHVERHLRSLRWRTLSEQVVVCHRGPLTRPAGRWAAVLGTPGRSVLGAWTALELHGITSWRREQIHLVVDRGAKPDRFPWLVVHESRRLTDDHLVDLDGLPVHTVARATVDAAAWQPSWRTAAGLLAAVVQQDLATVDDLLGMLDADIAGGADSLAEIDFARLCRRGNLPEPSRQELRLDAHGRRRFLDVEWRLPGSRRLVVEVDGVGHMERDRWYDDLLRDAEIGRDVRTISIRIPAMAARKEPERVLAILRRHLDM
jgi:hypothetical protein